MVEEVCHIYLPKEAIAINVVYLTVLLVHGWSLRLLLARVCNLKMLHEFIFDLLKIKKAKLGTS